MNIVLHINYISIKKKDLLVEMCHSQILGVKS